VTYYRIIRRNAAVGGSWLPSDLTSLYAWYDANSITGLSDGDPVSTWEDREASYDLTASGTDRPLYQTNELNGKPVVEFNGTRRIKASTAADWGFLHGKASGDKATIVAVWKAGTSSNPSANYALVGTGTVASYDTGFSIRYQDTDGWNDKLLVITTRGVAGTFAILSPVTTTTLAPNAYKIVSVWMDATNGTAASRFGSGVNGGSMTSDNPETASASTSDPSYALELGSSGGILNLNGAIAEVCIFNSKLSDADREMTEGYLAHKWGLASNLPNGHPYKDNAP